MITRRELLRQGAFAGAGLAVAGLAGCAGASAPASAGPTRQRLTLSWFLDSGYPSPFTFSTVGPHGVIKVSMLFDSLVWKDANGVIPWLARSWSFEDGGRRIVFRLRGDVAWHDGQALTADDVAFTFHYYLQHPFAWADTSMVTGATAADARTVAIELAQPFAPFLHDVAGVVPILPRHIWASVTDPRTFLAPEAVIGSGPYSLASYAEGQGAYLFKANPHYFAGEVAVKELAYALLPFAQQPLALEEGRIDEALSTDYAVTQQFRNGPHKVLPTPPFSIGRLVFNVNRPPFDRREFRQAIAYGLDRAQISLRVNHGDVVVGSGGVVPPGSPWFNPNVRQYPYDQATAKTLLDSIGYQRSTTVQLLSDPSEPDPEIIRSMLSPLGIKVRWVTADPKTRTQRMKNFDFDMALTKHIGVGGDPDFLRRWYTGKAFNAYEFGNVFHDADFLDLAERQAREIDLARRHVLIDDMQRILAEELPTLPLYHRRLYLLYDPKAWNGWFNTWSGIMTGIPALDNKLALLRK